MTSEDNPQAQDQLHPISTEDEHKRSTRQPMNSDTTQNTDTNANREHQTTQSEEYSDYKPTEHARQADRRHHNTSSIDNENIEAVLARLKATPTRFAILGAGLLSVLMNWISISVMGSTQSAPGLDILGGKLYILGILALIVIEFVAEEYRHDAWLAGGALLSVISIGSLFYIQSRIDEAMAGLGFFAGAVDASLGLGVYLAIIVALVITVVGYQNSTFDVGDL